MYAIGFSWISILSPTLNARGAISVSKLSSKSNVAKQHCLFSFESEMLKVFNCCGKRVYIFSHMCFIIVATVTTSSRNDFFT